MIVIILKNNGTGTIDSRNYSYTVRENGTVVEQGTVTGHQYQDGWTALVERMLEQREKDE